MGVVTELRHYMEKYGFYVSTRMADRLGMRARNVRITFIYFTFATLGAGFAVYLIMAFWLRIKDLIYVKRSSVFDL
ncbi:MULTISPECIES: PspC family transcriptional regulator [Nonlabens]|uniref:PspC family transcriptional regulator n=1 Tax=Nonlabens agnitus TaxID=870484 RepID=A0A2S9WUW5_9FLAO|nr:MULTISPECIES: PspC family transcriptional regulator [Nonlabens]KQC31886.1 PspC family transcriptional regulator [Nonlabens sp. YIK11]KQC34429.1 PspC family transcriptional regulator [Nonlabens sp. YIK11]PRP67277.1 PspC family transcriptional regulator [Nonlabens agnitus]